MTKIKSYLIKNDSTSSIHTHKHTQNDKDGQSSLKQENILPYQKKKNMWETTTKPPMDRGKNGLACYFKSSKIHKIKIKGKYKFSDRGRKKSDEKEYL